MTLSLQSSYWCGQQDLNLHERGSLDPESNASTNSAMPAKPKLLYHSETIIEKCYQQKTTNLSI